MNVIKYSRTILLAFSVLAFAVVATAQDGRPADGPLQDGQGRVQNQPHDIRSNVLRQLGLSREQVQQIRRINMERKPLMEEAQKRFREANRALDEAIYSVQVNETDVDARLKEVQLAQTEVAKIRFMSELAVRKILTPEQLIRFRDLRARFEQVRRKFEDRRREEGSRPANRQMPGNKIREPQDTLRPTQRLVRPNQPRHF